MLSSHEAWRLLCCRLRSLDGLSVQFLNLACSAVPTEVLLYPLPGGQPHGCSQARVISKPLHGCAESGDALFRGSSRTLEARFFCHLDGRPAKVETDHWLPRRHCLDAHPAARVEKIGRAPA